MNKQLEVISPEAMAALKLYDWEGNVRELENVIERAVVLCKGQTITRMDLPEELRGDGEENTPEGNGRTLTDIMGAMERQILVNALAQNGGSQTMTARELGIKRTTLRYKLGKYGLLEH
jgi:DNA-binding NtrC family response regulator